MPDIKPSTLLEWQMELMGCSVGEASILCEQADHLLRVTHKDGFALPVTRDLVKTRVNVHVKDDGVVSVTHLG